MEVSPVSVNPVEANPEKTGEMQVMKEDFIYDTGNQFKKRI